MFYAEGERSFHPVLGNGHDCFLDLEWREDFAAFVDDLLRAASDVEIAICVHPPAIPRVEPTILGECRGIERTVG
jgi:hypothetical protein